MVNNAGIAPEASNPRPIYETLEEIYDSTMRVNSKGIWLGCKYAGEQMMKQDILQGNTSRGWIINVSSVLGLTGKDGTSAYSASKGSVISMSRAVAMDYAPFDIHCNVICPGCESSSFIHRFSVFFLLNSRYSYPNHHDRKTVQRLWDSKSSYGRSSIQRTWAC